MMPVELLLLVLLLVHICMLQVSRNRAGTTGTSSNSSSRSRTLINGVATSLRVVRSIADVLVDVNGQAASQALRDTAQQLLLLDRIAGGWCGRCADA
jgi:DNA repair ATPase RecN